MGGARARVDLLAEALDLYRVLDSRLGQANAFKELARSR